jgi:hypothetical protein
MADRTVPRTAAEGPGAASRGTAGAAARGTVRDVFGSVPDGEVEFLTAGGDVIGVDDDLVEMGGRQAPRWAVVLGAVAVAAAFVTLAAIKSPPAPVVVPTDAAQTAAAVPFRYPGSPLVLGGRPDAVDLVIAGDRLYVLRPAAVSVVRLPGGRVVGSAPLTGGDAVPDGAAARLLADWDAARLWVVVPGGASSTIEEFDAVALRPTGRLVLPRAVSDAVAWGGHLYLATPAGLVDVGPAATRPHLVPGVSGPVLAVSADPRRHRLLVLAGGGRASIAAVLPDRRGGPVVERDAGELTDGRIVVVDQEIWLSGNSPAGAVLTRLEPATLAPIQSSEVRRYGSVEVAAGERVIWVSTGDGGLWCVQPGTGAVVARWPSASAPVASRYGDAYVIDRGVVRRLALPPECAG